MIKDNDVENFTFIDPHRIVHSSTVFYMDHFGCMHLSPLTYLNDIGIVHDDLQLKREPDNRRCKFVGHRRCLSPKQSIKPNKHNGDLSIDHVREIERQKNGQIVSNEWEEKEQIRFNQCNVLFTRIEQVFMTTATTATPGIPSDIVSVNSEEEIKQEEIKTKLVAKAMDALDCIKEQNDTIQQLTRELEALQKERQQSSGPVTNPASTTAIGPSSTTDKPVISHPISIPGNGEISYTLSALLDKYDSLDDDNKNELLKYAIPSGNENLQSHLLML